SHYRQRVNRGDTADTRGFDCATFSASGGVADWHRHVRRRCSGVYLSTATPAVRFLTMITAENITFRVGNKPLLSDISVSFAPAKLHLIVGPNGAGKSTLIKVLARLLRPQAGKVEYEGVDVGEVSEVDLAKRRAVLSQAVEVAFP